MFNHGWNHVNFTGIPLEQQKTWLSEANSKMQGIFGRNTTVFIPPYDEFDNNTLAAMKSVGFNIISSQPDCDPFPPFKAGGSTRIADSFGIYHMPMGAQFDDYSTNVGVKVPVSQVLSNITASINKEGYAIIVLHPQDFQQGNNTGVPNKLVNQTDINDLNTIINTQLSDHRKIESFSQVAGVALPHLHDTLPRSLQATTTNATLKGIAWNAYSYR